MPLFVVFILALLIFIWHLVIGASFVVWDHDVYYYQKAALALINQNFWLATNNYCPLLFSWLWGLVGADFSVLFLNAFFCLGYVFIIMLLAQKFQISKWIAGILVGFQVSLMRYGMQPLPDSFFLFFHLVLLLELTKQKPRAFVIVFVMSFLPWIRYEALAFYFLYPLWFLFLNGRKNFPSKAILLGGILGLCGLVALEHKRHGDFWPTVRLATLYPSVGEDQLVDGKTLWHVLANEGNAAPDLTPEQISKAQQQKFSRETQNAGGLFAVLDNSFELLTQKLWEKEQLSLWLLPFVLLSLYKADRKIGVLFLAAVVSVGFYSFLGVKERYLAFSMPLWLLLAARGLDQISLRYFKWVFLSFWVLWQIKFGTYFYRHPEVMLLEHRQAGQWIREQKISGSIMGREGVSALYAGQQWRRLPTNDKTQLIEHVAQDKIAWVVAGTRTLRTKRPWQTWLLEPAEVPWRLAQTFAVTYQDEIQTVYVYQTGYGANVEAFENETD